MLTIAAGEQAKSGHDILAMPTWQPAYKMKSLEPVDDIMRELIEKNGETSDVVTYLGKQEGHWVADLECGHSQHVRHRPPVEVREWVLTEEGRRGRIGASLPCRLCRMPRLPATASEYKRTNTFESAWQMASECE